MTTIARPTSRTDAHWYFHDGKPCYELPKKDGSGMKVPTLADARKLLLVPSVTTILKILNKPELINWIVEQAVLAVLTTPRQPLESDDGYVQRVLHDEKIQDQERDAAAKKGRAIHGAMQDYMYGRPIEETELKDWIAPATRSLAAYGRPVAMEISVGGPGFAGTLDLVTLMEPETYWLWDYKSTKKIPEKGAWNEHILQLAAYARAWLNVLQTGDHPWPFSSKTVIKTANLYISTTDPGKFAIMGHDDWREAWQVFEGLLKTWQWLNKYNPEKPK